MPAPAPLPASSAPATAPPHPGGRWPWVDALKGVACLLIVWHHFSLYGPLPEGARVLMPRLFDWLASEGRLAVQLFLVLGGFLAAASLAPLGGARVGRPLQRIGQRYLRLTLPYLVALTLCVAVAAWVRPEMAGDVVPDAPRITQLLAHVLLLQDLLGQPALSTGVWYVAVDFQLYALAVLLLWGADGWPRRVGMLWVLGLTALSLWVINRHSAWDSTAFYFFGSYGLGMLSYWTAQAHRPGERAAGLGLLLLLGVLALWIDWRSRIAIAWVIALLVGGMASVAQQGRVGALLHALAQPWQRLGRMSYSLFLIHFPVLLLVSVPVDRLSQDRPWVDALGLLLAFALSLLAASALHHWVERRPASGRLWLLYGGGFLLCGWLAALWRP